jgi:ribonuclease HI
MKVLQWNAGQVLCDPTQMVELRAFSRRRGDCDVWLLQEMGEKFKSSNTSAGKFFVTGRAAVYVREGYSAVMDTKLSFVSGAAEERGMDQCAVWVWRANFVAPILFVSIYRPPNRSRAQVDKAIQGLRAVMYGIQERVSVVGADINMHATAVGNPVNRFGGEELTVFLEDLQENGGGCLNTGRSTWVGRTMGEGSRNKSAIDISLFKNGDSRGRVSLSGWGVWDTGCSDHKRLVFTISLERFLTAYPAPTGYAVKNRSKEVAAVTGNATNVNEENTRAGPGQARCGEPSSLPAGWCRLMRQKMTPEALDTFTARCEDFAEAEEEWNGDDPEGVMEFADRVRVEIQQAAVFAGFLTDAVHVQKPKSVVVHGWNRECARLLNERDAIRRRLRRARNDIILRTRLRQDWAAAHRELKREIADVRRNDWSSFCSTITVDHTPKVVWDRFKRATRANRRQTTSVHPILFDCNGTPYDNPQEQANSFADGWERKSSKSNPSIVAMPCEEEREFDSEELRSRWRATDEKNQPAYGCMFGMEELEGAISNMGKGKEPGWDGVPHECLKALGGVMRQRLLKALNGVWMMGDVPQEWKKGILCPVPKIGEPTLLSNFRPVCLLLSMMKLLEAMVGARLTRLVDGPEDRDKRLSPLIMGFRANARAMHSVVRLVQSAEEAWVRKKDLLVVLFDIEGAFDVMCPDVLAGKLHKLGIRGRLALFICDYLRGRKSCVRVQGAISEEKDMELGTNQGGPLGPLLWTIYAHDFPICCTPLAGGNTCADDTAIWRAIGRTQTARTRGIQLMQSTLNEVYKWGCVNRLPFSATKTEVLLITPKLYREGMLETPIKLQMGGKVLPHLMEATRYLGYWLDPHLNQATHIGKLANKAWTRVAGFRSVCSTKWGPDRVSLIDLYKGWIRPIMEYGLEVYGGRATRKQVDALDKIQAACVRAALGIGQSQASTEAMMWEAEIQPLGVRRIETAAVHASSLLRTDPRANVCAGDFQKIHRLAAAVSGGTIKWQDRPNKGYGWSKKRLSPMGFLAEAYRVTGALEKDVGQRELIDSKRMRIRPPPWRDQGIIDAPVWPSLGSAGKRTETQKKHAEAYGEGLIQMHRRRARECPTETTLFVFTDGSAQRASTGSGGGACAVWMRMDMEICFTRTVHTGVISSNHLSEGQGLLQALRDAKGQVQKVREEYRLGDEHPIRIVVFSDSQASLRLVGWKVVGKGGAYWSSVTSAHRLIDELANSNASVEWEWIPGHAGIWQNEAADAGAAKAAQECTELRIIAEAIPRPHALMRGYVKAEVRWQMGRWWTTAKEGVERAKALFGNVRPPTIRDTLKDARLTREVEVCITKLRTGGETRPHARARMGLVAVGDESCHMCKGIQDGTEHMLLHCSYYMLGRDTLLMEIQALDTRYLLTLPTLVGLMGVRASHRVSVWQSLGKFLLHKDLGKRLTETQRKLRTQGPVVGGATGG